MKTAIFLYSHTEKPRRDGCGGPLIALTYDGEETLPTSHIDQWPSFHEKLTRPETIQHIIEVCCLVEDKFEGDESYMFKDVEYRDFGIVYTFKNSNNEEIEVWFAIETITVV